MRKCPQPLYVKGLRRAPAGLRPAQPVRTAAQVRTPRSSLDPWAGICNVFLRSCAVKNHDKASFGKNVLGGWLMEKQRCQLPVDRALKQLGLPEAAAALLHAASAI